MANKSVVPPVPRGLDRELTRFLDAMRENAQIQKGSGRANPLDRAVLWRDWVEANGSKSLSVGTLAPAAGEPHYGDPKPPQVTGVEVLPTFQTVLIKWDRPNFTGYKATEVFRLTSEDSDPIPSFDIEAQIGSVATPFFTDYLSPNTRATYWVRHINRDNIAGPLHSVDGTTVTTFRLPIDVLKEYSNDIYQGENYQWLRSSVGIMDAVNRAYQSAGLDPDSNLFKMLAQSSSLSDLLAEQALAESLDKHTQRMEIKAQFSKNYARLSGGVHAAVNLSEAYVNRIQTLESNWDNGLENEIQSKIDEYDLALTSPTGAIATQISAMTVSFDGNEVSLDSLASTVATAQGTYAAQWGIKTNVNDLQGGVGFYNDGIETSFVVDAGTFAVTGGDGGNVFPLVVKNGEVVMASALIDHAEIYDLIAENITAQSIKATIDITSPRINGGSITGTTLNINNKFTVDANGRLYAVDGEFSGIINATDGYLDNVTIRETCNILGSVNAKNIDGDVVDRAVVVVSEDLLIGPYSNFVLIEGDILPGVLGAEYDRVLVVSGICIDHEAGGGSRSNFEVVLFIDGVQVQRFRSHNNEEEGSVSPQMGYLIPRGSSTVHFSVNLQTGTDDHVLVQQSAIVADVFKPGNTIKNISGLHTFASQSGSGSSAIIIEGQSQAD